MLAIFEDINSAVFFLCQWIQHLMYVDQLQSGPVQRFLTFINISTQTGKDLAIYLLEFMSEKGLNINCCHGQSYHNASNMSGKTMECKRT